jgi:hypothetical protein
LRQAITDTGTDVVEPRGRGRPPGSTYDHLDTGPLLDLHQRCVAEPVLSFEAAAKSVADRIHNAECIEPASQLRRLRRSYPRWLEQHNPSPEYLSED